MTERERADWRKEIDDTRYLPDLFRIIMRLYELPDSGDRATLLHEATMRRRRLETYEQIYDHVGKAASPPAPATDTHWATVHGRQALLDRALGTPAVDYLNAVPSDAYQGLTGQHGWTSARFEALRQAKVPPAAVGALYQKLERERQSKDADVLTKYYPSPEAMLDGIRDAVGAADHHRTLGSPLCDKIGAHGCFQAPTRTLHLSTKHTKRLEKFFKSRAIEPDAHGALLGFIHNLYHAKSPILKNISTPMADGSTFIEEALVAYLAREHLLRLAWPDTKSPAWAAKAHASSDGDYRPMLRATNWLVTNTGAENIQRLWSAQTQEARKDILNGLIAPWVTDRLRDKGFTTAETRALVTPAHRALWRLWTANALDHFAQLDKFNAGFLMHRIAGAP